MKDTTLPPTVPLVQRVVTPPLRLSPPRQPAVIPASEGCLRWMPVAGAGLGPGGSNGRRAGARRLLFVAPLA